MIITRGVGEAVVIGDDIRIKVLGYVNGQVELAFDIPSDIKVNTKEAHLSAQQEFVESILSKNMTI